MREAVASGSYAHLNKKLKTRHLETPNIAVQYSANEYSVEGPGDRGKGKSTLEHALRTSEELDDLNVNPVEWDGRYARCVRSPVV